MAMFISKFHKLIESKVFWYGIIGVMIVTMTLSLVPNVHDYGSFIKGFMVHNAGKLNGREISVKEYTQATQLARRSACLTRTTPIPSGDGWRCRTRRRNWGSPREDLGEGRCRRGHPADRRPVG
ncbi:MAG: hypothetical protein U1F87_10035 [Kiritimatiellia bacterium]